jgi:hypothetical protein
MQLHVAAGAATSGVSTKQLQHYIVQIQTLCQPLYFFLPLAWRRVTATGLLTLSGEQASSQQQ